MLFSDSSDKLFRILAFVLVLHVYICVLRKFCICLVDFCIFAFFICALLYMCPALFLHLCTFHLCIFHVCIVVFVLCVGFAFVWWIACGRNQSGNHGCNSHNALKSKKPNGDPADCCQVKRKQFDIMIINCISDHRN